MASKRSWLRRARSLMSEMLPFDTGAKRKLLVNRTKPGFTSGQASRRCQAKFKLRVTSSGKSLMPNCRQKAIEHAAMQDIEFRERNAPGADLFHARLILGSPRIRKCEPIECIAA